MKCSWCRKSHRHPTRLVWVAVNDQYQWVCDKCADGIASPHFTGGHPVTDPTDDRVPGDDQIAGALSEEPAVNLEEIRARYSNWRFSDEFLGSLARQDVPALLALLDEAAELLAEGYNCASMDWSRRSYAFLARLSPEVPQP